MNKVFYTDTELLQGLAAGDRTVVASLYKLYLPVLTKWILSRGGLDSDADDIFQEALLVVYEKAKSPEFCLTCKLSTYLFAVSKRLWYKKLEQSANFYNLDTEEGEDEQLYGHSYDGDVQEHWEKEAQFEQLNQALDQLGEPCAALLKSFYIDKKNMQEIAEVFKYTNAENAKTQKYKCLTRLKKIFFTSEIKAKS